MSSNPNRTPSPPSAYIQRFELFTAPAEENNQSSSAFLLPESSSRSPKSPRAAFRFRPFSPVATNPNRTPSPPSAYIQRFELFTAPAEENNQSSSAFLLPESSSRSPKS